MATYATETFESGTSGVDLSTSNTTSDLISVAAPTFSTDAHSGSLSMYVNQVAATASNARFQLGTVSEAFAYFWIKAVGAWPTGNGSPIAIRTGATIKTDIQIPGGIVRLRGGGTGQTLVYTAPTALPTDVWLLLQVHAKVTGTTQDVTVWNTAGTKLVDSGAQTWAAAASVDNVQIGSVTSIANTIWKIDDLKVESVAVTPPVSNVAPVASFTHTESALTTTVTSTSTDSDGTITSYDWNWGDGTTHGTTASATHTYATAGTRTVTLTVTDNATATGTATASVTTVAGNVAPVVSAGSNQADVEPFAIVQLAGTATDSDGTIASKVWTKVFPDVLLYNSDYSIFGGGVPAGWVPNSLFENYDTDQVLSSSTVRSTVGAKSLLITCGTSTTSEFSGFNIDDAGVTFILGHTYVISADVYVPTGSPDVRVDVAFYQSGPWSAVKDAWHSVTTTYTHQTPDAGVILGIGTAAGSTAGQQVWVDKFRVKEAGLAPLSALSSTTVLNPTYEAVGAILGGVDTWRLTATDNSGASTSADVTVTVLPANEFVYAADGSGLKAVQYLAST